MATNELSNAQMQNNLLIMGQRISNNKTNSVDVMNSMNTIQKFLVEKYQSTYLPFLDRIFELLLRLCDDPDVSVRHTASVVLSSTVTLILPFQKSMILKFISDHCNKSFQPHALISMLDLELKVTLFLTHKVALQLFSESATLFNFCARSSSEIVAEGFNNLATQIRQFFPEREKRLKLISILAKPKDSILSTRWSIKTAAIFAQPDLIEESLKFFKNPFSFLASCPFDTLPNVDFSHASLEEILPFIELQPNFFFDRLSNPPENPRELSAYFSCLKATISYGVQFPIEILTNSKFKGDPILYSLQLECFALTALRDNFEHSLIFDVFKDAILSKSSSSVSALSIVFNVYPSVQLFEIAIGLPITSPAMCKSLIIFLTEIDFTSLHEDSMVMLNKAIEKLTAISHSSYEMVQSAMIERAPYFNCGLTYPLFKKISSEINYFDPAGFRNSLTILSVLTNEDCGSEISLLFSNLLEVDPIVLYGDANSLKTFLTMIRRICLRTKNVAFDVPEFIFDLPLLALRIIIAILNDDWNETAQPSNHIQNSQYNELLEKAKSNDRLVSILSKQSLITLLEIRDCAAACVSAVKAKLSLKSKSIKWDEKTIDLLGKKLIAWPSKRTWLLITNSAKSFTTTTAGVLSVDPKIALSAALKNPEKFNVSNINGNPGLTAFAICNDFDIDFEQMKLTPELIESMDSIATTLPTVFVKKLQDPVYQWLVVYIQHHIQHEIVSEFKQKPFEEWNGPIKFWKRLPFFLNLLHKNDNKWVCQYEPDKCDEFHKFFALRNIRYFSNPGFANYVEIDFNSNIQQTDNNKKDKKEKENKNKNKDKSPNKNEINLKKKDLFYIINGQKVKLEVSDFYEPEMLRGMRCILYSMLHYNSFEQLCSARKLIRNCNSIVQSVIKFLFTEDCGIECFSDALLLCLEFSVAEQADIDPVLIPFLKFCPFRGYNALFFSQYLVNRATSKLSPSPSSLLAVQIPQVPNFSSQIFLESEMKKMLPIFIKLGKISEINNSGNKMRPLSHITSYEFVKYTDQKFYSLVRYNVIPQISNENINSLKKHIDRYGISLYAIKCLKKWINESGNENFQNEIVQLINFVLNYIASYGTYFTAKIDSLMIDAMRLNQNVLPVVEAFVLVLPDTPFKKGLEAGLNAAKQKYKNYVY